MTTETLFKAAGISDTTEGTKFHVSRDTKNKEMFVAMNGTTTFTFFELPTPMTKIDAAKWIQTKVSVTAAHAECINKVIADKTPVVKAPKAPKAPKAEKAPKVAKVSDAAKIIKKAAASPDAKAARLELIKNIAAKRNKA